MPKSKGRRKPRRTQPSAVQQKAAEVSPTWYMILMLSLMGIGLIVVVLDYLDVLPGGESKAYLIGGLVVLAVGFLMTLSYRSGDVSPKWYVVLMFSLMGLGIALIVLNYIDLVPGGQRSGWLYSGLGAIAAGFLMTMNYH
jgi:hypothetical protein